VIKVTLADAEGYSLGYAASSTSGSTKKMPKKKKKKESTPPPAQSTTVVALQRASKPESKKTSDPIEETPTLSKEDTAPPPEQTPTSTPAEDTPTLSKGDPLQSPPKPLAKVKQDNTEPPASKPEAPPDTPPLQQDEPIAEGTQILVTAPWGKDAVAVVSGCYSSPEGQWWVSYKPIEQPLEGWTWDKGVMVVERVRLDSTL